MSTAAKLEQLLNELADDRELGGHLRLVSGQVTAIVRFMGVERSWSTIVRVARRVLQIEEERGG